MKIKSVTTERVRDDKILVFAITECGCLFSRLLKECERVESGHILEDWLDLGEDLPRDS